MKSVQRISLLCGVLLATGNLANATQLAGNPTPSGAATAAAPKTVTSQAQPTALGDTMTSGVIEAIDQKQGRIMVNHVVLHFDPAKVRVFRQSAPGNVSSLAKGMKIRLLLSAADRTQRTVSTIYY